MTADTVKRACDKSGVQVFNCNPDSALKVFPIFNPAEVVEQASQETILFDFSKQRVECKSGGCISVHDFADLDKKSLQVVEKLQSKLTVRSE